MAAQTVGQTDNWWGDLLASSSALMMDTPMAELLVEETAAWKV